ncbi:MAG: HEAT repeat domain-containing protein [Anaerolineales bacterium]
MDDLAALDILTNIDLLRNMRAPIEKRRAAAEYLADKANPVALPVMIRALEDPDFFIRKSAINACERYLSPMTVDALIRVMHEHTFSERQQAVRILGKIGDRRAVYAIAEVMEISDWMAIRSEAAAALGHMGYPEVVPALIRALEDFEAPVRANAAEALGKIRAEEAVEPLIAALKRESGWNMRHMSAALVQISEPAMRPLLGLLADVEQSTENRELAAESLTQIIARLDDRRGAQASIKLTVDLLVAELQTRTEGVRSYVARAALTRISGLVAWQLIEAFATSNPEIRDQVAYILGDSPAHDLNAKLVQALGVANDQVAAGAARVLYFRGQDPRQHGYHGPL